MRKTVCFWVMIALTGTLPALALQVLYTAEGDTTKATDRLTGDGAQNGAFTQTWSNNTKTASANVYVTNVMAKAGASSFRFNQTPNYLHTIDITNSSTLGSAFTLAAFVRPDSAPFVKRIFSTYPGENLTANRLIFDYGSGSGLTGMRLAINAVSVMPSPAVTIPSAAYSHLAATYDNGAVKLYLNGKEVGSGMAGSGTPVIDNNAGWRIQVGEDWAKGFANSEQTVGYMDDILIYDRALSSNEIAEVAMMGAEFFFQKHKGVLYTAEGDTTNATDSVAGTLYQDGVFSTAGVTVSTVNPKFGASAFNFVDADSSGGSDVRDVIVMPNSRNLGDRFTLAAYVDTSAQTKGQRLFSNYLGGGIPPSDTLIFNFDPDGAAFMSLWLNNVYLTASNAVAYADGAYHHLAVTYDNGPVTFYLDGAPVGSGTNGSGAVTLARDLQVGEDYGPAANEQLLGDVDDILLLHEALSPADIVKLATKGAWKFLNPPPKGTTILVY